MFNLGELLENMTKIMKKCERNMKEIMQKCEAGKCEKYGEKKGVLKQGGGGGRSQRGSRTN